MLSRNKNEPAWRQKMTTAALSRLETGASHTLGEIAVALFEGIAEGREMAARYERLSRMSNSELARLGITRQDIPRVAVNGLKGN
jgi:uncharacterized protein YjiS (DUF1127 family)